MSKKRSKWANKCKDCSKIISSKNKSGYCSHHYRMHKMRSLRKIRKENHLCTNCGKRVEPLICYYPEDPKTKITKYFSKCYKCRIKDKEYKEKQKIKNNKDYVTTF